MIIHNEEEYPPLYITNCKAKMNLLNGVGLK